jgi:RimJ/RimL family protein N-acetyltransferase
MFHPTQPIKTDRLVLRRYRTDDLDALHNIERLPDVRLFSVCVNTELLFVDS